MADSPLIRHLSPTKVPPQITLRLLHGWKLGDPTKQGSYIAFGTAWNDFEGSKIQGDTDRRFGDQLMSQLVVGSLYRISGFGVRDPRDYYRTSRARFWLDLPLSTRFDLLPEPEVPFPRDSFSFSEFEHLATKRLTRVYLTDIIGKVVAIGDPNYVQRGESPAPVQTVRISNERGVEIVVSLWADLSTKFDAKTVIKDDKLNPCIMAFTSFMMDSYNRSLTAKSSPASRVFVHPQHARAEELHAHFSVHIRHAVYIEPKFGTPEKLKQHVSDSYRTVEELDRLSAPGADLTTRFRCTATIVRVDSASPWAYRACKECSRALASDHGTFWCEDHKVLPLDATEFRYKLKLHVRDQTGETVFALLGYAANRIMPISAAELVQVYSEDFSFLPPAIDFLVGQTATFEVQLPKLTPTNPYADFRISSIAGLNVNRYRLRAQLPKQRSPSPPSPPVRGSTPLPPDPAWVPPVMTYTSNPPQAKHSARPSSPSSHASSVRGTQSSLQPSRNQKNSSILAHHKLDKGKQIKGSVPASAGCEPIFREPLSDSDDDKPLSTLYAQPSARPATTKSKRGASELLCDRPQPQLDYVSPFLAQQKTDIAHAVATRKALEKEIADTYPAPHQFENDAQKVRTDDVVISSAPSAWRSTPLPMTLAKVKLEKLAPAAISQPPTTPAPLEKKQKDPGARPLRNRAKKRLFPE